MEDKKKIMCEEEKEILIQDTLVEPEKQEENRGIGYEIVIDLD